jgi:hypothetical protein
MSDILITYNNGWTKGVSDRIDFNVEFSRLGKSIRFIAISIEGDRFYVKHRETHDGKESVDLTSSCGRGSPAATVCVDPDEYLMPSELVARLVEQCLYSDVDVYTMSDVENVGTVDLDGVEYDQCCTLDREFKQSAEPIILARALTLLGLPCDLDTSREERSLEWCGAAIPALTMNWLHQCEMRIPRCSAVVERPLPAVNPVSVTPVLPVVAQVQVVQQKEEKIMSAAITPATTKPSTTDRLKRAAKHGAAVAAADEASNAILEVAQQVLGNELSTALMSTPTGRSIAKLLLSTAVIHASSSGAIDDKDGNIATAAELVVEATSRDFLQPHLAALTPKLKALSAIGKKLAMEQNNG